MPTSILTAALTAGAPSSLGDESHSGGRGGANSFVNRMAHSGALSQLTFAPPSQPTTPSSASASSEPRKEKEKRPVSYDVSKALPIFREMVSTEERFVSSMRTLVTVFIEPLQALSVSSTSSSSRLSSIALHPQVQVFFSTATQILTLNSQFSEELSSKLTHFDEQTDVGVVFLHYAPLFRCYGLYASSHERVSAQLLASSRNDAAFRAFVEQATADPRCKGQTLESLLIMPIQRIPRYRLLLEELRKKTPDAHPGYDSLMGALAQVNDAAVHINESIRRRENREKLSELTERFVAGSRDALDLLDTDVPRQLIREGELTRITRRGSTVYYFHLFNDLLLYSEDTVKGYKLHRRVDLSDRCSIKDRGNTDAEPWAILIASPQKSFVVCAKSEQEKRDWLVDLTQCVTKAAAAPDHSAAAHSLSRRGRSSSSDSLLSSGGSAASADPAFVAPLWTSDHSASQCTLCSATFTFFNRRHHCRQCGVLVCSACSAHKLLLPAIHPTDMQRVCDGCYKAEENAGGPHCAVAACTNKRERGPYCASHAPASSVRYAESPSSRANRGSNSFIGRMRLTRKPDFTAPVPDKSDKNPFFHALPFASDWHEKVDEQLSLHPADGRLSLIAELYSTEVAYLTDLHALLELYVKPLLRLMESSQSSAKGRRSEVAEIDGRRVSPMLAVFLTGVESLYDLSVEVGKQLGVKVEEWKEGAGIGDVFVRYGSLFALYLQYGRGWRGAMKELDGLGGVVKRLEDEAKRKMKVSQDKEKELEESRRESRVESRRYDEQKEDDDDDDPTAAVNHSAKDAAVPTGRVSFDPAAIAKAALRVKKSRDLKAAEAAHSANSSLHSTPKAGAATTTDDDDEPKDVSPLIHSQPPSLPPSLIIPLPGAHVPPPLPPKPLTLPEQGANPLSPSSPSTPVSRSSTSMSRGSSFSLGPTPSSGSPSSSLVALSSSPLHRLSQYSATFTALLAITPPSHPDHASLTSALSTISSLHTQLQRVVQEADNAWRMQQLQARFVGGGGKDWVRDGEEKRVTLLEGKGWRVRNSGGPSPVHLHLLTDALLMSDESGKAMLKLLRWMPLHDVQVIDDGKASPAAADCGEYRMLVITPSKQWALTFSTDAEKADWLKAIKAAVKALYTRKKDPPSTSDPTVSISRSASRNNLVAVKDDGERKEPDPVKDVLTHEVS